MTARQPHPSATLGNGFTSHAGVGVLLVNLGTPSEPTPGAIAAYLREFLSDRRVVDLPRALWLPILYGLILPLRPWRLARAYEKIWTAEGSPLLTISLRQMSAVQQTLGPDVVVALGMRYGHPGVAAALKMLERHGVRRVLVLPLYPQYSASTTASALDAVFAALARERWLPELRTVNHYHDHPDYVAALAQSVRAHWADHGRGDHLLMSFHGVPRRY
ncbi:MAG: ferrochelatase, partial [Hydrocarboniphaga effusa]|nr:ferrochelatase [Hydrocarboniphaga effusa]